MTRELDILSAGQSGQNASAKLPRFAQKQNLRSTQSMSASTIREARSSSQGVGGGRVLRRSVRHTLHSVCRVQVDGIDVL